MCGGLQVLIKMPIHYTSYTSNSVHDVLCLEYKFLKHVNLIQISQLFGCLQDFHPWNFKDTPSYMDSLYFGSPIMVTQ